MPRIINLINKFHKIILWVNMIFNSLLYYRNLNLKVVDIIIMELLSQLWRVILIALSGLNLDLSRWTRVQPMKENGLKGKEMVLENKFGLMGAFMKVNGRMTKAVEKVSWSMLMEIYMKVIGMMIKLMGREFIFM